MMPAVKNIVARDVEQARRDVEEASISLKNASVRSDKFSKMDTVLITRSRGQIVKVRDSFKQKQENAFNISLWNGTWSKQTGMLR
jgi:hypothetical protein